MTKPNPRICSPGWAFILHIMNIVRPWISGYQPGSHVTEMLLIKRKVKLTQFEVVNVIFAYLQM